MRVNTGVPLGARQQADVLHGGARGVERDEPLRLLARAAPLLVVAEL